GTAHSALLCAWTVLTREFASACPVQKPHLCEYSERRHRASQLTVELEYCQRLKCQSSRHPVWWMSVTQVARCRRSMSDAQRRVRHGLGHVSPALVASCWRS